MTSLDIIVLLIVGLTTLRGLMRGMADTVFSLLAWLLAFALGKWGAMQIAPLLPAGIDSPSIRYLAAFAIVFLLVLVVVMLIGHLLASTLKAAGLGGVDTVLGGVAGLLKGAMIVVGFTLLAGLTALPRTTFWQSAKTSNWLEAAAVRVLPLVPNEMARYIKFNK